MERHSELYGTKVHGTTINDMKASESHFWKESILYTKENPNSLLKPVSLGRSLTIIPIFF